MPGRSPRSDGVLLMIFGCIIYPSTQLKRGKLSASHFGPSALGDSGRPSSARRLPAIPAGPEIPQIAIFAISAKSVEILTEKGMKLKLNGQKVESGREEHDPANENGKFALVLRNLEIGGTREPSPENREILPDPDGFNSGEALIDHGEASAVSRTVIDVHSGPHRGVQGRELPPAAPSPPFPAIPAARWLTGLGPFLFLCRPSPSPFRPSTLRSGPEFFRPVSPSGRQSDPIRSDTTRFVRRFSYFYRITPQLSELGKFST
ncbi:hypothetical protein CRG98_004292 [Punica granatum]|uniref:Uncharacterized protein n=1 Tax=Punica granatum TaxID=22663 RepID=A0A2I0L3H9_PUNGR|nr:hypothetical protein CRG98_004292 [Punica granatum]